MQRRRFFVAKTVQQAPGRSVELAVQVRRTAAAPMPVPPPASPVLSWMNTPDEALAAQVLRYGESGGIAFEVKRSEDGLTHIAQEYDGLWERQPWVVTGWAGSPWRSQANGVPLPMIGPHWHCTLLVSRVSITEDLDVLAQSACYAGVVLGVSPERITWQLQWTSTDSIEGGDRPPIGTTDWAGAVSQSGHVARTVGCQVLVYPLLYRGGTEGEDRLTATALVDGIAIGVLHFVAQRVGW